MTERFARESLNPRLVTDSLQEGFARLGAELLPHKLPGVRVYPTAGRDGGIDFVAPWADGRLVGDFKCLSEDGLRPAQREWHVVAERLTKHLASAAGPTSGQSQYAPWYSVTDPIRAYRLCTSSHLKNLGQDGTLVTEIRAFFADLAARHAHLSHLRDLDVGIIDWSDLEILLSARPEIALRWFPALRPLGLTVLDDAVGPGRFREYLLTKKLKYYSRRDHHARFGGTDAPMSEDDLLALIDYRTTTGLVITGPGGVGKTRLSLELGRRAEESDAAVVLRATRKVDLELLNDRLPRDSPLLILIDYAETQKDFDVLVSTLNDLTDQFELRVGWIATCRTSFYPQLEPLPRHVRFDLRDQSAIEGRTSEHDFNAAVVRHILETSGVGASADALRVCRSLPVLAVFLAYLIDHDRPLDLAELLGEQDFGSWVAHRIQLSFAGRTIGRELAMLAAMLPLDPMAIDALTRDERDVFNRLAADGWIEREAVADRTGGEVWVSAHDVLADQVLLSYLRTIPPTADTFVRELLKRAADIDALDSVVFSLQRIAAEIPRLPIHALLDRSMTESPDVWRQHRNVLIGTSLLSVKEQLRLLAGHAEVWADAEYDVGFQNRIGWLTRYASNSPGKAFSKEFKKEVGEELGQEERDILRAWIPRVAPRTIVSNFALTWGLRFAPDLVRESAKRWIVTRPHVLQTHYLLGAWLEMGLPVEEIESAAEAWLRLWSTNFRASFLYRAWLKRNRESRTETIRPFITQWLSHHRLHADAQFFYSSWLDATKDRELVEQPLTEWLAHEDNRLLPGASYCYTTWLVARGDRSLVENPIADWLAHPDNRLQPGVAYICSAWLTSGGDPSLVAAAIAEWLGDADNRRRVSAAYIYSAWLPFGDDRKVVESAVADWLAHEDNRRLAAASFVYRTWLAAGGDRDVVKTGIADWLAQPENRRYSGASYVYAAWLEAEGDRSLVESSIAEWLTIDENRNSEAAAHVYSAWLKATRDREFVESSIKEWLTHEPNTKTHNADWVYGAWLETDGDPATIQLPMLAWLGVNGLRRDADFVLRAWLDAGGAFSTVREHALAWFETYAMEHDATYVLKFITKQRGLPIDVNRKVLEWCRQFADDPDAIWRFSTVTRHLGRESADDAVFTAHAVLQPILSRPTLDAVTHGQVASVLCDVVAMELRQHQRLSNVLCELIATWFNRADFFDALSSHAPYTQTREFLVAVRIAVGRQPRSASVEKILQWVDTWDETRRTIASDVITPLRRSGTPDLSSESSIPLVGPGGLLDAKIVAAALVDLLRADVVNPTIAKRAYVFASNTVAADATATLSVLDALVAAVPDDAAYWNLLGIARRDVGLLPEALDAARHSTKLKPEVAGFWYSLGRICEDAGRFDESEAAFVEALRLKNGKYVKADIALERVRSRTSPRS